MKKATQILHRIILSVGFLFNVFFVTICWIEFYSVGILNKTADYPFGGEVPVPYYYKTSELYAQVNLIWGIIFFTNIVLLTTSLIKRERRFKQTILIITWVLIVTKIVHGLIGVI